MMLAKWFWKVDGVTALSELGQLRRTAWWDQLAFSCKHPPPRSGLCHSNQTKGSQNPYGKKNGARKRYLLALLFVRGQTLHPKMGFESQL